MGASGGRHQAATSRYQPQSVHVKAIFSYFPRHLAMSLGAPHSRTIAEPLEGAEAAPRLVGQRPTTPVRRRRTSFAPLGLLCILIVQALLSLRLMWSNTAFLDEATYLNVGHVELAHWFTGTPDRAYPTYLSGAPVIYPPLAALANSLGGLAAARILSLGFMLGATSLLWGMTSRLAGPRSAFFASALFAALGPTQDLGAFATYDAMALFLMAAATWCAVACWERDDSAPLVIGGAVLLALANATKYATALFDPVIFALAALSVAAQRGRKRALGRAGYFAVLAIGMGAFLLAIGGPLYVTGVMSTTLARPSGVNSPLIVLTDAAKWIGPVVVLAVLGAAAAAYAREDRVKVAVFAVLAAAGLFVPANQARIHTTTSLYKHVDFGAWFAAAAAGYLLARVSNVGQRKSLHAATAGLVLGSVVLPIGVIGRAQASDFFRAWPNNTQVIRILSSLTRKHPGNYLAEDYDVPAYYLEHAIPWQRWSSTWYFTYTPPGTARPLKGPAAYRAAIDHRYFSLIILDFGDTVHMDKAITAAIRQSGDYRVIAEAPYWDEFGTGHFTIWAYQRPTRHPGTGIRRH